MKNRVTIFLDNDSLHNLELIPGHNRSAKIQHAIDVCCGAYKLSDAEDAISKSIMLLEKMLEERRKS